MDKDSFNHHTKITAPELATLWSQYMNDSLSRCILRYFVHHVKDENIKDVLIYALDLSERHLQKVKVFLTEEKYPIPIGFTDEDVNLEAPPLFTDTFMIIYIHIMSIHGLTRYAGAMGNAIREDQRQYMMQVIGETLKLVDRASNVLLNKGILSKPPVFNNHQSVDFLEEKKYLTGWLGKRRPISAVEISGTYMNMQKTMAKIVLELGFSQVAQSKEVRKYMERSRHLCHKHFEILSSMLEEDNLNIPKTLETEVTDSTVPPFSDKLIMTHIAALLSSAIGYYGEALSMCQRRDLSASYARMIAEMGVLAEDGINLLIKNEWMEQPPIATDHEELAKRK
ncbi:MULTISPECIES: DUF3231 family protein [Cytobacillus]|uniref:DUF3231 family protein n=1 Tax=Cytobacillus oceanisediminis TaxID=665099 RepID=UPI00204043E5|nr:DUF3231 family protein [Cytobacillus oceanisediminis]MCM3392801.1 DUF3231 family protein [Cytobacillus oceanisediminis]